MDEHRLGLKPVLQDVGSKGTTDCSGELAFSVAMAVWLCSPSVGRNVLVDSAVNINLFKVLADFANILALKTSKSFWRWIKPVGIVEVPEGIHLEFMPSHSELQPAERLWPLTNEAVANQLFQTLDDLEEVLFSAAVPY